MKSHELTIQGMSCAHCVIHVKQALSGVAGLEIEDIQIGKAKVKYDETKITKDILSAKIEEAGYQLVSIQ
jgi:copper chaperone